MSSYCAGSNREQGLPYDPSIWAVDEDDVLNFKDLYGSLGSHEELNATFNQIVPPSMNGFIANNYPDIKPHFPLSNNHSMSMPVLPIQNNENLACQRSNTTVISHNSSLQPNSATQPGSQSLQPSLVTQSNRSLQPNVATQPNRLLQPSVATQSNQSLQPNIKTQPNRPLQSNLATQHNPATWCNLATQLQQTQRQIPDENFNCSPMVASSNVLQHLPTQSPPQKEQPTTITNEHDGSLITFVDLKSFYEKGQVRLQGKSEQRLDYSTSFVRIYMEKPDVIKSMTAFVERYPDAAHILKDSIGSVPLKILPGENQSWVKVNLDDAGCEVYKLSKVKGEERNRFHVVLDILSHDGSQQRFFSDTFQVKSKPKTNELLFGDGGFEASDRTINFEPDTKKKALKRSRTDDSSDIMISSPQSVGSVFPEVITDHLQATTATIDQLRTLQPIQTHRGDIAYHFKLTKQPSDPDLEEGDIIGFFETTDGKTEIKRLTCENVHDTKMAGVVSRSAWLEGRKPDDNANADATDMVCVIGVVKVKVRGPVKNGERIYASLSSFPGVAMAEDVITKVTSNELTLIGQSLEAAEEVKADQISLVSCFVSVLLSISTKYTAKAMKEIRSDVLVDVDVKISKEKRKCIQGLAWKLAIVFVFLGLLTVLLHQLYAPQTAYRYWQCKKGSTGETSSFTFTTARQQIARVKGVEFEFNDLIDKLDLSKDTEKIKNHEDHRYYLNVDRCAAGGLKSGVYGPEFYVIDNNCTLVYYYLHNKVGYTKYLTQEEVVCSHYVPTVKTMKAVSPMVGQDIAVTNVSESSRNETSARHQECYRDVETKYGSARFTYTSSTMLAKYSAGIRVDIDLLRRKTNQTIEELPKSDVCYYFNVQRCTGEGAGPSFFAIVGPCDNAYYYSSTSQSWRKYRSAREFKCVVPV